MDDLYRFFSKAAHPNRELVAERFLGEGNEFVLGSIGRPSLILVADHCIHLVEMWFWFGALVAFACKELMDKIDPMFGRDYFRTATKAEEVKKSLVEGYNALLKSMRGEMKKEGP